MKYVEIIKRDRFSNLNLKGWIAFFILMYIYMNLLIIQFILNKKIGLFFEILLIIISAIFTPLIIRKSGRFKK